MKKLHQKKLNKKKVILSSCRLCLENGFLKDYEILTLNQFVYVLQPKKTSFPGRHFLLVPTAHNNSTICLEREEYLELRKMKLLLEVYLKMELSLETVVYETAFNFGRSPHCYLEIFGVEAEYMFQAGLFIDTAFRDIGDDWSTHKKA